MNDFLTVPRHIVLEACMLKILYTVIDDDFTVRNRVVPSFERSLLWAVSEIGEAAEKYMELDTQWVRNNPENHLEKATLGDVEEELGDVIYMILVAAMTAGLDPLTAMIEKAQKKIDKKLMENCEDDKVS